VHSILFYSILFYSVILCSTVFYIHLGVHAQAEVDGLKSIRYVTPVYYIIYYILYYIVLKKHMRVHEAEVDPLH
jgi:hypothetical protein